MNPKYPDVDMSTYDSDEQKLVARLENMLSVSKKAREDNVKAMRRSKELYDGKILKPFNLPKYKSRIEPSIINSTLNNLLSVLTDRRAKIDIMPKRESQIDSAKQAQEVMDNLYNEKKLDKAINVMKFDGLLYGNGYIKIAIIDDDIQFTNPDPFGVYFDPLATSIDESKCVTFCSVAYVDDIKDMYGKEVKPEGKVSNANTFVKDDYTVTEKVTSKTMENLSPLENEDASINYRGGQVQLKECWYYEGENLKLATWANGVLLVNEDAPYPFIPLVSFINESTGHSVYGTPEATKLESLAVGASIALSQSMDNLILHGNPAMVMSKSLAKSQGNRPSDKPGQIFYIDNPGQTIQRIPGGNISSSSLPMAQTLIELADKTSAIHEVSRGIVSGSVTAGKAIQALQEASSQVARKKERDIGNDALVSLYKKTIHILKNNLSTTIEIRLTAEDGSGYQFMKVNPYELDSELEYKYVIGSMMPESRVARFDQAIDLLQLGLLDQEEFWRWTQSDITKDKLDTLAKEKALKEQQLQQEMDILSQSTDEDEIMESLLRQRNLSGMDAQTQSIREGMNK